MVESVLPLQFRRLPFNVPELQQSPPNSSLFPGRKDFPLKFLERNKREAKERKPRLRIVKAAASPSPAFGGSSSPEYSGQLLGGRQKKKQSVAGIDQDELLDPVHLADQDSCFCEFKGLQVHYKVCEAESETPSLLQNKTSSQFLYQSQKTGPPVILLHGFGASVFSWHQVMKPLSRCVGSKVLAFDRPAFGLTSRVNYLRSSHADGEENSPSPYSTKFSVLTTLYFMDFLASEKAILIGHSAGSLIAVGTYFQAPERVAALILVAPAIVAPLSATNVTRRNQVEKESQIKENESDTKSGESFLTRLRQILSKAFAFIVATIMRFFKGMMYMVNTIYKKALSTILRSAIAVTLVRMIIDKFGIAAIRNSWYDAEQITNHTLHGYTKPLRTKGWDKALVEYTVAMLTDSAVESDLSPARRLNEISCPVLIITGDSDRLVPPWNSKRLARAIPGSHLEIIQKCGHLPHEERPEEFISVVQKFLQNVFAADSGRWCVQA